MNYFINIIIFINVSTNMMKIFLFLLGIMLISAQAVEEDKFSHADLVYPSGKYDDLNKVNDF